MAGFRASVRLLHVVPTYLPATRYGGPIYSVHALCRTLAKHGHDVHVFTTNVDGSGVSAVLLGAPVDLEGVMVWYFPTSIGRRLYHSPAMAAALAAQVQSFDCVHLHSVFLWPTMAAARAAVRCGVPYVIAPRGMLVGDLIKRKSRFWKQAWIALFERRNLQRAAAVHVTSEIEATELRKLGLPARRIVVVPNGVDMPTVRIETAIARQPGVVRVVSLGRINWKKGLDRLIEAMVHVPKAELVIAGNDEEGYQTKLEDLAVRLGVAARVRFPGPVHGDAKWQLLESADVFVLPSHSENFGNAVLEAMAAGVPVVVTPSVGLAAAIASAGAGLVVEGTPEAIATAICDLLADPALRQRMAGAGRRTASETFSWEAVAHALELVYADAAAGRAGIGTA